jgi:predicted XRE-type DNA-binding protein
MDDAVITVSGGNIFRDLGRANADELQAKAELSLLLTRAIREQGLTQRAAADLLGVSPPDVSDLVRGKLARFSYERLIRFLIRLGANVAIVVSPPKGARRRARLTVARG